MNETALVIRYVVVVAYMFVAMYTKLFIYTIEIGAMNLYTSLKLS